MIRSFRDLDVWRTGMELAASVYQTTATLPRSELFGLTSQMRRAAVSIPSNVAEGKAMGGNSYPQHVKIALGSEAELQTQIELARKLKMLSKTEADALLAQTSELGRMLVSLLNSLSRT
ncbi:MAG TPA: four helix bundle protein [Vicinamibacterales bacterium]|nr:four helix bundle protein [Vicinamibacterales bacterium]